MEIDLSVAATYTINVQIPRHLVVSIAMFRFVQHMKYILKLQCRKNLTQSAVSQVELEICSMIIVHNDIDMYDNHLTLFRFVCSINAMLYASV